MQALLAMAVGRSHNALMWSARGIWIMAQVKRTQSAMAKLGVRFLFTEDLQKASIAVSPCAVKMNLRP